MHIHVNGDAGLDLVLDTIAVCQAEHLRRDHRTVIVRFANSTEEQIDRIASTGLHRLGQFHYPVGFADQFAPARHGAAARRLHGACGLGTTPGHPAVAALRSADGPGGAAGPGILRGQPPHAGRAGRRTGSADLGAGRPAGGHHRAAYSWRLEGRAGQCLAGKSANFTVLAEDPYAVEPERLGDIAILGTVYEGRWFPAVRSTNSSM